MEPMKEALRIAVLTLCAIASFCAGWCGADRARDALAAPAPPVCPSVIVMAVPAAPAPSDELAGALERCKAINAADVSALIRCQQKTGEGPFDPKLDVWTEDDVRALETDDYPQLPASAWKKLPPP